MPDWAEVLWNEEKRRRERLEASHAELLDLLKEEAQDRQCADKCDGPNKGCPCWYCRTGRAIANAERPKQRS